MGLGRGPCFGCWVYLCQSSFFWFFFGAKKHGRGGMSAWILPFSPPASSFLDIGGTAAWTTSKGGGLSRHRVTRGLGSASAAVICGLMASNECMPPGTF